MIIQPKDFIKEIKFDSQIQPAGVDLTIKQIEEFLEPGAIDAENKYRVLPKTKILDWGRDEKIHLKAGVYKIVFNEIISVPENAIGIAQSRSSLLRTGNAIFNAIWDPGYSGRSEALLAVFNPYGLTLYKNARIVQIIFIKMQKKPKKLYSGIYQNENKC